MKKMILAVLAVLVAFGQMACSGGGGGLAPIALDKKNPEAMAKATATILNSGNVDALEQIISDKKRTNIKKELDLMSGLSKETTAASRQSIGRFVYERTLNCRNIKSINDLRVTAVHVDKPYKGVATACTAGVIDGQQRNGYILLDLENGEWHPYNAVFSGSTETCK